MGSSVEQYDIQWRPREVILQGERVMIEDYRIPPGADIPLDIQVGLGCRAIVNAGETCPRCGARAVLPDRAARRRAARNNQVIEFEVAHAPDCPAWLRGWRMVDLGVDA